MPSRIPATCPRTSSSPVSRARQSSAGILSPALSDLTVGQMHRRVKERKIFNYVNETSSVGTGDGECHSGEIEYDTLHQSVAWPSNNPCSRHDEDSSDDSRARCSRPNCVDPSVSRASLPPGTSARSPNCRHENHRLGNTYRTNSSAANQIAIFDRSIQSLCSVICVILTVVVNKTDISEANS